MWALTKEQRMTFFDSKLGQLLGYFKQNSTHASLFFITILYNFKNTTDCMFALLACSLFIYFIDSAEFYYNKLIKKFFMGFDICLIILSLVAVLYPIIHYTFTEYLIFSFVVILVIGINLALTQYSLKKHIIDSSCKLSDYSEL